MKIHFLLNEKPIKSLPNARKLYHLYDASCMAIHYQDNVYLKLHRMIHISKTFNEFLDTLATMLAHETFHASIRDELGPYGSEKEERVIYKVTEGLTDKEIRERRAMYWKYQNNPWYKFKAWLRRII